MTATDTTATVIGAQDAKTRLGELLDRVERGEEIVITRHGRPVARLSGTGPAHDRTAARAAAAALMKLREEIAAEGGGGLSIAEIIALRDEGRPSDRISDVVPETRADIAERLAEFRRRTQGRGSAPVADLLQESREARIEDLTRPSEA